MNLDDIRSGERKQAANDKTTYLARKTVGLIKVKNRMVVAEDGGWQDIGQRVQSCSETGGINDKYLCDKYDN
jgi:hypothetical protein